MCAQVCKHISINMSLWILINKILQDITHYLINPVISLCSFTYYVKSFTLFFHIVIKLLTVGRHYVIVVSA